MAKQQTFADKLKKGSKVITCAECGDPVRIAVCKCNRKEVYG
jgi:hypothetical protein